MTTKKTKKNRLAQCTSPYLLQHATNPVDWYPWGEEALTKAKQENKPIMLSIGYSACHWCHVMAHESFEDDETAKILNEHFISIKVDREERTDLDKIYQLAHQLLNNRGGGWPLTIFLTPNDQIPFFSGTYFPLKQQYGMPAFKDVLLKITNYFSEHHKEIVEQNKQVKAVLLSLNSLSMTEKTLLDNQPIILAHEELERQFDSIDGGFGSKPKFPHAMSLALLLNYAQTNPNALKMLIFTLDKMSAGGIFDQLGGGFFRYTVDNKWMIPHFEKMLYDNALLLELYAHAYQATGTIEYAKVATETADWVTQTMQAKNGGYYATLDADSEGHEGKYYYWDREQIRSLLADNEYALVIKLLGVAHPPNFELHWHFYRHTLLNQVAEQLQISISDAENLWQSARRKLLHSRNQRILPHRDEKILTAWNALMIKSMIIAGFYLERADFAQSALKALNFIITHLWQKDGLYTSYKDGRADFMGYLDDYAFLLDACLTVIQFHWDSKYLQMAIDLADTLLDQFYDNEHGGFFFTAKNHEQLIVRLKPLQDEAIPAGNAIAALALNRLGILLSNQRYLSAAENTIKVAWPLIEKYPSVYCSLLSALDEYLSPPQLVILIGKNPFLSEWKKRCLQGYHPHRLVFAIPENTKTELPEILKNHKNISDTVTAYVCSGTQCLPAITKLKDLDAVLK